MNSKHPDNFIKAVQTSKVKQPTQIGFSKVKWAKAYKLYNNSSESDKILFDAGLWFNDYLNSLRELNDKYDDKYINIDSIRRGYVGLINRDYAVAHESLLSEAESYNKIFASSSAEIKLPIGPGGRDAHMIGTIEGGSTAVKYPLSETFKDKLNISKKVDNPDLLNAFHKKINLASAYQLATDLWLECLWNGWQLDIRNEVDLIVPPESINHISRIVSHQRYDNLMIEFTFRAAQLWSRAGDKYINYIKNEKKIVDIYKVGKTKKFRIGISVDEEKDLLLFSSALSAEELYWNDILLESLPNYQNLTVRDIIRTWELLASLGHLFLAKMPKDTGVYNKYKLFEFAPKYRITELYQSIRKALGYSNDKIKVLVDLLTFNGDLRQDPWIKPLVPLSDNYFCALAPPLCSSNRIRLIESWMREGGIKLTKRGDAFEQHVRDSLFKTSLSNKLISNTFINKKSVTVKVGKEEEEIDLVWIVDKYILIGEIKCQLFPSSPLEVYNYFDVLISAANQIKRKQFFVQNNLPAFFKTIKIAVQGDINRYRVLPTIITNLPFGAGYPIETVPVTDLYLLSRYLEGQQKFLVETVGTEIMNSQDITYYSSEQEAGEKLYKFLMRAPIINMMEGFTKTEICPLLTAKGYKNAGYLRYFVDLP